ncbi:hypothetical protein SK128_018961 [Halocaridina rubra]|uniref:Uncharacterized protein n=1 Tax=Halocaridina rubra TaxID=373956 RepID=A0AAN9A3I1_HALRR
MRRDMFTAFDDAKSGDSQWASHGNGTKGATGGGGRLPPDDGADNLDGGGGEEW